MRKLLSSAIIFVTLSFFSLVGAKTAGAAVTRGTLDYYCTAITIQQTTLDGNQIKIALTSPSGVSGNPDADNVSVGIKDIELSNASISKTFQPTNGMFFLKDLTGGRMIIVPTNNFIDETARASSTSTKFDMKIGKTLTTPGGQSQSSCNTTQSQAITVPSQAQAQPPLPLPSNSPSPTSHPLGPRAFGITFCDAWMNSMSTAIGCIPVRNTYDFVSWIAGWLIGISGGIAFLIIIWSGFQIMTASGNQDQLQAGREMLTAAVSGLILIIFSIVLLKLIGVDILHIPGIAI